LISQAGLRGGLNAYIRAIEALEFNCFPKVQVLGEPQLGKRGLYPETSTLESTDAARTLMDFITYADGSIDLLEIAEKINIPIWELYEIVEILVDHGLISTFKEQA
jgi:aminopeptidase-like protein